VGILFLGTGILLGILGWNLQLHWEYWLTLILSIILWSRQYYQLLNPDLPKPIYAKIFRNNVGIGFILLGGMIGGFLL
jgi:4-hydroxybenzoate polyprenyltransferase